MMIMPVSAHKNYITPNKRKKTPSAKEGKKRCKMLTKVKVENDNRMKQTLLPFVNLTNINNNNHKMSPSNKKK